MSDRVLRQNFARAVLSSQKNHNLYLRSSLLVSNIYLKTRIFERKGADGTMGSLMRRELRGYLCVSVSQLLPAKEV